MLNSMTTSIIKIQITNEKRRQCIWWIMTSSTVPILHLYIKKEEPSVNFSSRTNINKSISGRTKNLNPLFKTHLRGFRFNLGRSPVYDDGAGCKWPSDSSAQVLMVVSCTFKNQRREMNKMAAGNSHYL